LRNLQNPVIRFDLNPRSCLHGGPQLNVTLQRVYFINSLVNFPRRSSLGEKSPPSLVVFPPQKHEPDVPEPGSGNRSSIFQWGRTILSIQLLETAGRSAVAPPAQQKRTAPERQRPLSDQGAAHKEHDERPITLLA